MNNKNCNKLQKLRKISDFRNDLLATFYSNLVCATVDEDTVQIKHCALFRQYTHNFIIGIIGIQPLGRFGQRPELSQSTGIALVRCILGNFLGVVCHCFPPWIDFPLSPPGASTTREILAAVGGNVGKNVVRLFCRNDDFQAI